MQAISTRLSHPGEDWRTTLQIVAELLGCKSKVIDIVGHYEQMANEARRWLKRSLQRRQTVAFCGFQL